MTSTKNLLTAIAAALALSTALPAASAATGRRKDRANDRRLRRINMHENARASRNAAEKRAFWTEDPAAAARKSEGGLEEDVAFWTNLVRRTQAMSIPPTPSTPPPVPTPMTQPPVVVDPTPPPFPDGGGGSGPMTQPPVGVITNPPVPVVGAVCAQGETCSEAESVCSDGTTEECCGQTFDSFVCTCIEAVIGELAYECEATNTCRDIVCDDDAVPGDTPSPVPAPVGFNCPAASFVGCTAVDPANPTDECPTLGEPCPNGLNGEFCCQDGCPRNYCTAKQAPVVQAEADVDGSDEEDDEAEGEDDTSVASRDVRSAPIVPAANEPAPTWAPVQLPLPEDTPREDSN